MYKIILLSLCFFSASILISQDSQLEGSLTIKDSLSIGTTALLDQLYLFKRSADPSFTLHKSQPGLFGSTDNDYGRIWQNTSLNLAYDRSETGSEINLHDNFMKLNGKILLSPYDACDLNGSQEVRLIVDRGVQNICPNPALNDCSSLCAEDVINFYPEQPFDLNFHSKLGTNLKPWSELNVENAKIKSMEGSTRRNVEVTSEGRLVPGNGAGINDIYTVQPNDFGSAFYQPFHEQAHNRFIGGNLSNNLNAYTAAVHLPHGATVDSIKFTYRDESTSESLFMLLAVTSTAVSGPTDTYSYSSGTNSNCGTQCSHSLSINRIVNNEEENYFISVRPNDLTWDTVNEETAFGSAIIYYRK